MLLGFILDSFMQSCISNISIIVIDHSIFAVFSFSGGSW